MCTLGLDIDHIDGLTCGDVQLVSLYTAKTEVRADLRELNQADSLSLWAEDVDAIVAIPNPAASAPDISFNIAAKTIRHAACFRSVLHRHLHAGKDTSIGCFLAIYD
ncbi:MAG: hypothetical protein RL169_143, partial [Armatimonadota bacterium]